MATAGAAYFDGTNDYMTNAHTDVDDTKFVFSGWVNTDITTEQVILSTGGSRNYLLELKDQKFVADMKSTGAFNALRVTGSTVMSTGTWYHIYFSCDLSDTGKRWLYINGVAETPVWTTYDTTRVINFDTTPVYIGAWAANPAVIKFQGGLSQLYWNPGVYLDAPTYIDKFYSAGSAVPLGDNGELPTGSSPRSCWQSDFDAFNVNDGLNGDASIVGALTSIVGPPILAAAGGGAGVLHVPCERACHRSVDIGLHPFGYGYP